MVWLDGDRPPYRLRYKSIAARQSCVLIPPADRPPGGRNDVYNYYELGFPIGDEPNQICRQCPPGFYLGAPIVNFLPVGCRSYGSTPVLALQEEKGLGKACPLVGNPINPATGNKYQSEIDYVGAGPNPLSFERHYNSRPYLRSREVTPSGRWTHSYSPNIELAAFSGGPTTAYVERADGQRLAFVKGSDGQWRSDADVPDTLESDAETGGWALRTKSDAVERYDSDGRLRSTTNRGGHVTSLHYSEAGQLESVDDGFGRTLGFIVDPTGRITELTDPAGSVYRYSYDEFDNVTAIQYPDDTPEVNDDNPVRQYHYEHEDHSWALTGITDENGVRHATFTYDAQGRATSTEHAGGAKRVSVNYHEAGSASVTDANGETRRYDFALQHGVYRVAAVDGGACSDCTASSRSVARDANGYPTRRIDANGNATETEYNARGLQVLRREGAGSDVERTIQTAWHPDFRVPTTINRPSQTISFTYDEQGRRTSATVKDVANNDTRTTVASYSAEGLITSVDGPREDVLDVTRFSYDAPGNRAQIENALGHVTHINAYDIHGRPLQSVDPNGLVSLYAYDARGRLLKEQRGSHITTFTYSPAGQVQNVRLGDASGLDYGYDAAGRVVSITDTDGNALAYTLDAAGNRIEETVRDPSASVTRTMTRVFDTLGRLRQVVGGAGDSMSYEYDDVGNRTSVIDGKGSKTNYAYDSLNRLIQSTAADGGVTGLKYDERDNLVSVIDPLERTTTYSLDGLDRHRQLNSPDTGITTYAVDAAGNRTEQVDARGVSARYQYDVLNRLIAVDYDNDQKDIIYTYDEGPNAIGRLSQTSDEGGITRYTYDVQGNVLSVERTIGESTQTVGYRFDDHDRLIGMLYPSGLDVSYELDGLGRVQKVAALIDGETQVIASDITYRPFGPRTSLTYGNGLTDIRSYDQSERVTQIDVPSVHTLNYTYDGASNPLSIADAQDSSRTQTFRYGPTDRLIEAEGNYGIRTYTYDNLGNRQSIGRDGVLDNYVYASDSHRLLDIDGPTPVQFTYDEKGNTVRRGDWTYLYDEAGRMTEAQLEGQTVGTYSYSENGTRATKRIDEELTYFVYGLDGQLISETSDGARFTDTIRLGGDPLAVVSAATPIHEPPGNGTDPDDFDKRRKKHKHAERPRPRDRRIHRGPRSRDELPPWRDRHPRTNIKSVEANFVDVDNSLQPGSQGQADGLRATQYFHLDHLGAPKITTDGLSQVVWRGAYEPFGSVDLQGAASQMRLRFPGQYFDEETTMHYNYYRYYDPTTGRYLKSDPIGLEGGFNTYSYVANNPLRYTDPLGLLCPPGERPVFNYPSNRDRFDCVLGNSQSRYSEGGAASFFPPNTNTQATVDTANCVEECVLVFFGKAAAERGGETLAEKAEREAASRSVRTGAKVVVKYILPIARAYNVGNALLCSARCGIKNACPVP